MKYFYLILFFTLNVYSEKIFLKDGTILDGNFEGIIENNYMIRTKYGVLSVKKEDLETLPENTLADVDISTQTNNSTDVEEIKVDDFSFKTFISSENIKKIYYDSNIIIATETFNLKNEFLNLEGSLKDGKYFEYYEDGKIKTEKNILNNKDNGQIKIYYPDNTLQVKANYKNGLLDGTLYFYSPEGKIIYEQNYKDGLLNGDFIEYDSLGNINKKTEYVLGKIIEKPILNEKENDVNISQEIKEENNINPLSLKKMEIARGNKYIVYFNKKYKGVFILDGNHNLISIQGYLPEGKSTLFSDDSLPIEEFIFKNNKIKQFNDLKSEKEFYYNEKNEAIEKKK